MFAFSTVEHMGIILAAVGLGASVAGYGAMQQIVSHCVTKSFCFFAAGAVLLAVETREIAAVRGLIRQSPIAGAALVFGGLAIAGAPPMAVFLSEFSILKAGLTQKEYVATGLLAIFIVIAFFGIMLHINRMVFGARENETARRITNTHSEPEQPKISSAVQLPAGADFGRRAGARARLLHSPTVARLADSSCRRFDENEQQLP